MRRFFKAVGVAVGVIVVGVAGFAVWAARPAIAPAAVQSATSFDAALVARGEKLAAAGYCLTCHTSSGGKAYAGGLAMVSQFGTIYSTNITPDVETGIGAWSLEAFERAMHEGVARDGSHLFPAFPYDHFTKVSDSDVEAIYAFLMTRPAVNQESRANTLPFPLNVRLLQAGWKLLFFKQGRYEPVAKQSPEWNRGAYLAEGLSHCASCHSPRNALGAEKTSADARYSGAVVDGWDAPPLTAANPAPVPWDAAELYGYLRNGGTPYHGVAAGPMSEVVRQGMALVDEQDARAVATYVASIDGSADRKADVGQIVSGAVARSRFDVAQDSDRGAHIYMVACASCHYNPVSGPQLMRPELGLKSSVSAAEPTNLVQVIVYGVSAKDGLPGAMMPAFGSGLSDDDIAALANYLRTTRTGLPAWQDMSTVVTRVRSGRAA